jgi:hypothetical protein
MSFDDQILFDEGGPLGHDGSWCAVNPVDGKLYMSRSDADPLILYAFDPWTWSLLGSMEIRNADGSALALPRVQGGVFSPNGHLYLTDSEEENIYLIDMLARRVAQTIAVANNHELEGLTILDLDQVVAPCRDPASRRRSWPAATGASAASFTSWT